jgi:hypothetical protein
MMETDQLREATAALLCDDIAARIIAGQEEAPMFAQSSADVQDYWRALAAALSATAPPQVDAGAAADIVARLKMKAETASKIQREMAQDKSLRNSNGEHDDLYMWPEPDQTLEGRAAALIELIFAERGQ